MANGFRSETTSLAANLVNLVNKLMSDSLSIIPAHEHELFGALPDTEMRLFERILFHLPSLTKAKSLWSECRKVAPSLCLESRVLYERVRRYVQTGDWKCLVNRAKVAALWKTNEATRRLPVRFQQFYQSRCEKWQRNNYRAWDELLLIWKTRHDFSGEHYAQIPGYESGWPEANPTTGLPNGWSYRNLSNYNPENYESAASRIGRFAASKFVPPVFTTRTTLKVCERVEFDDHEWNVNLHYPGQSKAMRPRGFGAVEALCDDPRFVWKMTLWDEDEEKKKALTERDFQWFCLDWLTEVGYRTDERGTILVGELGMAALRQKFADRIWQSTNKHVKAPLPGKFDTAAHGGQFKPRGKGNFKRKPLVEAMWSLVDNYFAALPGQTGLSRLTAPEEWHGCEHYLQTLLKAVPRLAPEESVKLRLPVLTYAEFAQHALVLTEAIRRSSDHALEGWDDLGFHAIEWRVNALMPWTPRAKLLQMPEAERTAIEGLLDLPSPIPLRQARNLSRGEAFALTYAEAMKEGVIERLSPWKWGYIMGLEAGIESKVNEQHLFKIQRREFGPAPLYFLASINDRHLRSGETYTLFVNPWRPQRGALVCKADGAALGLVEMWNVPGRNDGDAIARMAGKQKHWESTRLNRMNERHADDAAKRQHMIDHNDALLHPGEKTAAERAEERALNRKAIATLADDFALPAVDTKPNEPQTDTQLNALEELL